ncbi:MAG: serine/threonine-protein kinase [Verrucomicrobiota bacterium]
MKFSQTPKGQGRPDHNNAEPTRSIPNQQSASSAAEPRQKRYQAGSELGSGGEARIFRGFDTRLEQDIALKLFHKNDESFEAELAALEAINHHNVVKVLDRGKNGERPFLVTEFITGADLAKCLSDGRSRKLSLVTPMALQILEALAAVHEAGFCHLDLKASNIMVTPWAPGCFHYTLIDFGHSRQIGLDNSADPRRDLFALGKILYKTLTGREFSLAKPTPANEFATNLSDDFNAWLMNLLDAEIENRPASAKEALKSFCSIEKAKPVSPNDLLILAS